ncbi:MFS transporter [Paraburkholderia caribensis]|uniref:MFS transporter n=1 Tax=Paraburkholderia caribensis TaxID=75105 RepID=UPI001CB12320|nr:MFS transporter [Paraburkholderia caribensis]CAG9263171.1 4-hydroxybenzoate transporter [Paraburkholderia caribensis]
MKHYDVGSEIDRRPIGRQQWWLFALCGLVILLDGFDIQVISFTAPLLAEHLGSKVNALGLVFAAGLAGLTLGSIFVGPIADRYGRKRVLQAAAVIFGVFTTLTVFADTRATLLAFRFCAGVGLGGCIPNALALVAEYAPHRARARTVAITVSATPLGAVIGGIACWALIPQFGWRVVYLIGGIAPIVLSIVLGFVLPESIRFLVAAGRDSREIAKLLKRIAPDFVFEEGGTFRDVQTFSRSGSVRLLFAGGQAQRTLLLWIPYFMVFLISFLISSWLPSVLKEAGLPLTRAMSALIMFNIGGVAGGALLGKLVDRYGGYPVLTGAFVLCAMSVAALGYVGGVYNGVMLVIFLVGIFVQGTICTLYALASGVYPTEVRVTGIGWAAAVGRFGAIFGPLVGGAMLQAQWGMRGLFLAATVPALISVVALLRLNALNAREGRTAQAGAAPGDLGDAANTFHH